MLKVPEVATPPTTTTKLLLDAAPAGSVTVTVIVELPLRPATGVIVRLRFVPLPPKTMFVFGARLGLDDLPVTTRLATGDSPSPIVNGIGGVVVFSGVIWSRISLMMGGVFDGGSLIAIAPLSGSVFVARAIQSTRLEDT